MEKIIIETDKDINNCFTVRQAIDIATNCRMTKCLV
nr:MAG TPA: hypothetical protein [Caudoviricetes sp.]